MSASFPPSSVQQAVINDSFSDTILQALLLGIYTVVYIGTLYIYTTKKTSQHWVVLATISLSYIVNVVNTATLWWYTKLSLVDHGDTRETAFAAIYYVPGWLTLFNDICCFAVAFLADGLLIWRCFVVWNRSRLAIFVPSFLLFSETAINLTIKILASTEKLHPTRPEANTLNSLIAASFFITSAATISSTLLISYRILSFLRHGLPQNSKTRMKHIIEILVQSAAAYSLATIAFAIPSVIPDRSGEGLGSLLAGREYTYDFYLFIAGVAPTIMVARVVITSDANSSAISHISGLQFQGQHTLSNSTRDTIHIEHGESDSSKESDSLQAKEGRIFLNA